MTVRLAWEIRRLLLLLVLIGAGCEGVDLRERPAQTVAVPRPAERLAEPEGRTAPSTLTGEQPQALPPPAQTAPSRPLTGPEIYRGTGSLMGIPAEPVSRVTIAEDGDVTLNFVNADIREVIDAVLGETLGLNYYVDPRVRGTITTRTSRPLARTDVLGALENILALNGLALEESDGLFGVIPIEEASASPSSPVIAPPGRGIDRGFGIHIIPLRFVSATTLRDVLEPFVPPGRMLNADPARNLLIFTGTGPEARDMQNMVDVFDADWMEGMSFALLPLQFATAETMVAELQAIFGQDIQGPLSDVVRFVPVERMNAVLVISPQPDYVDQAQIWVERLDRGEEGAAKRIFVYYVQHGRAEDLADVLTQLLEGARPAGEGGQPDFVSGLAPGLIPAEIAPPEAAPQDIQDQPDEAEPPEGEDLGGLRPPAGPGAGIASALERAEGIQVIADETNNALVIRATPAEYRTIEETLQRLDLVPLQVLLEATIAEVTLNDLLRFGVEWFFRSGDFSTIFSTAEEIAPAVPGFSLLIDGNDGRAVLNALSRITDVKVISSPQLLVLDNQTARLQVGDQVPVAVQSAVSVIDPDSPIVNSIEFRDTGVILEITPRVNASGLVVLDILQEVSDPVPTTSSTLDSPTIQERSIASRVAVESGETIALGGLIRDSESTNIDGIPLLSQIPILGNLFKVTSDETERTELLVLITPHVVRDSREAREVTRELQERLRAIRPLESKIQ